MTYNDPDETCEVDVDFIKAETDKAWLFVIDDEETWVAKSQITDGDELEIGDENVTVTVPMWLAEQNGWDC